MYILWHESRGQTDATCPEPGDMKSNSLHFTYCLIIDINYIAVVITGNYCKDCRNNNMILTSCLIDIFTIDVLVKTHGVDL